MISLDLWRFVRYSFQFILYFFILDLNAQQLNLWDLNAQNYVVNNPAIWESASFLNIETKNKNINQEQLTHTDFQISSRASFERLQNLQTALGLFHCIQNKEKDDHRKMFIRLGLLMLHEKNDPLVISRPLIHGSTIFFLNDNSFLGLGTNLGLAFAHLNGDLNPYDIGDPLLALNQTRFNTQAKLDVGVFYQHYGQINGTDVHPFIGIALQNVARQTLFQNIENHSLPLVKHWVINAGFIYNLATKPSSQYLELNFLGKSAGSTPLFTNTAIKYHNYGQSWKIFQVVGLGITSRPKWETAYVNFEGSLAPNCKMGLLIFAPRNRPVAQLFGCGMELTFRYTLVKK